VSNRVPEYEGAVEQLVCESIIFEKNFVNSAVTDDCGAG
jgi:hypothetical protein